MISFKRIPEDQNDEFKYLWRIGTAIESGVAGVTWEEAAPYINAEWRDDESSYRTSSAYRKPVQYAMTFYKHVFEDLLDSGNDTPSQIKIDEIYRLKKQMYDQRREYNKIQIEQSRSEHLHEELIKCAKEMTALNPVKLFSANVSEGCDAEAVVCFADWHYGMVTDNIWNKYNSDICLARVKELVAKTVEILKRHNPSKIHILLLGDACHGAIHTSARVASEENTCDQIIKVSEIIANAIAELSQYAPETFVYSTYGNHMRTIQNKGDSIHSDNMEKVIPWWIKERLSSCPNITIVDPEFFELISFNVCGYTICATHGDLDSFKDFGVVMNTVFTKVYGTTVDYAITADKHHLEEFERYGIDNILVRSLCGTDEYANNRRLYSDPGQTVMIFTPRDGRQCTYNIKFSV